MDLILSPLSTALVLMCAATVFVMATFVPILPLYQELSTKVAVVVSRVPHIAPVFVPGLASERLQQALPELIKKMRLPKVAPPPPPPDEATIEEGLRTTAVLLAASRSVWDLLPVWLGRDPDTTVVTPTRGSVTSTVDQARAAPIVGMRLADGGGEQLVRVPRKYMPVAQGEYGLKYEPGNFFLIDV